MGFFSRFEHKMEDTLEGAADKMSNAPISPVQIAKKAEKEMRREKMVGAGKQYAPTLYTVLVNSGDDRRLFGYYPTLAGETETYLKAKAAAEGLTLELTRNPDILAELGRRKTPGQILVGFAAESREHQSEGRRKLEAKNLDLIVVNDILGAATGFDAATNRVTLIDREGSRELALMSKEDTADHIWDAVRALLDASGSR